jgi:hypothetical protein
MPDSNNDLYKMLGAIEATQKLILEQVKEMKTVMRDDLKATNIRVDKLEVITTNLRIKLAAAGTLGSFITIVFTELFKRSGGQ